MIDRTAHWNDVYAHKQPTEVSWHQETPAPSLALIDDAGITPDLAVIDVGAGASRLTDALLDRGFRDLTALDISAAALECTRARLGARAAEVAFITTDITTYRPQRSFDVWHDRAVLHFLTDPAEQRSYVNVLRAALKPGGHAIIAGFAPDGPTRCSDLDVVRHSTDSMAELLSREFKLVQSQPHVHTTPWGKTQAFLFTLWKRSPT